MSPPLGPWPLRVAWLGTAIAAGPAIGDGLDGASDAMRWVVAIGTWSAWAVVLVAVLVPTTATLTVTRIGAGGAVAVAAWAATAGASGAGAAVAVGWCVATAVLVASAPTTDAFVDGSSYGDERRFALRTPVLVLVAVPVAWAAVVAGVTAGPLLLAARQWVPGGLASAAGGFAAYAGFRALHQLSRRWLVFVPAGVVVHDPLTLAEPVLCRRTAVDRLRTATVGDLAADATVDLTNGAPGLAVAVDLRAPVELAVLTRRRDATVTPARRLLVAPVRPGAVLAEARARRLAPPN